MQATDGYLDSESLTRITQIFSSVWREATARDLVRGRQEVARARIVSTLCAAVIEGERDDERLRRRGIEAIETMQPYDG